MLPGIMNANPSQVPTPLPLQTSPSAASSLHSVNSFGQQQPMNMVQPVMMQPAMQIPMQQGMLLMPQPVMQPGTVFNMPQNLANMTPMNMTQSSGVSTPLSNMQQPLNAANLAQQQMNQPQPQFMTMNG